VRAGEAEPVADARDVHALVIVRAVKKTRRGLVRAAALVDLHRIRLDPEDTVEPFLQSGSLNTRRDLATPTFSILAQIHPFEDMSR